MFRDEMENYCGNCGLQIKETEGNCPHCGAPLGVTLVTIKEPEMFGFEEWAEFVESLLPNEKAIITVRGEFHSLGQDYEKLSHIADAHIEIFSANPKTGSSTIVRLHWDQAERFHFLLGKKLKQAKDWHDMKVKPFLDKQRTIKSSTAKNSTASIPQEGEVEEAPPKPLPKPIPGKNADLWIWLLANYGDLLQVSQPWRPQYMKYGLPPELRSEIKRKFFNQPRSEQEQLLAQFHSYFPDVTGSYYEWLEKQKGIKYDHYMNMSNEEKAKLFDEWIKSRQGQ